MTLSPVTEQERTCKDVAGVYVHLARLDERLVALGREMVQRDDAGAKALVIAAQELARRLDILNGEHARSAETLRTFLPRVEAALVADKLSMKSADLEARVGKLEQFESLMHGRMWLGGAVILVLAAVMAAAARML
jgi:hypothetical protein